jgi:hypothetical protein
LQLNPSATELGSCEPCLQMPSELIFLTAGFIMVMAGFLAAAAE